MTTNNENIINDVTRLEIDGQNTAGYHTVEESETAKAEAKSEKSENSVLKNVASGAAGAAVGVAGMMVVSGFKVPEEPIEDPEQPIVGTQSSSYPLPEPAHFNGAEIPVAHNVTDDMSFSAAFATARREVGAGGVFQWHGGVYGTYYANEWRGFSSEYRHSFSNYPYRTASETFSANSTPSGDEKQPEKPLVAENKTEEATDANESTENVSTAESAENTESAENASTVEAPESAASVDTPNDTATVASTEAPATEPSAEVNDPEVIDDQAEVNEPEVIDDQAEVNDPEVIAEVPNSEGSVDIANTEDISIVGQDDSNFSVEVDGPDTVIVDSINDDNYDITVVDDYNNPELPSNFDYENTGTEVVADDSSGYHDYASYEAPANEISPDFNNNADVSNFV